MGGGGGCWVPPVEEAVVLEAATAEECLVGVEGLDARQRSDGGAEGRRERRKKKGREWRGDEGGRVQ